MNYKYIFILLSMLIIFSKINCMEQTRAIQSDGPEEETGESEFSEFNYLPEPLVRQLINNVFYEPENYEQVLQDLSWKNWTDREIKIISEILATSKAKGSTQLILNWLHNLQSIFYLIQKNDKDLPDVGKYQQDILELMLKAFIAK